MNITGTGIVWNPPATLRLLLDVQLEIVVPGERFPAFNPKYGGCLLLLVDATTSHLDW